MRVWLTVALLCISCTSFVWAADKNALNKFYDAHENSVAITSFMRCAGAGGQPQKSKRECTKALKKNVEFYNLGNEAIKVLENLEFPNAYSFSRQDIREELRRAKGIVNDTYIQIAQIYAFRGTHMIGVDRDQAANDCDKARQMSKHIKSREDREFIALLCF